MKYRKTSHSYGNMTVAEKIAFKGVSSLSNNELLQAMVGSGGKDNDCKRVARCLSALIEKVGIDNLTVEDVKSVKGIGSAKAALLFAALEFCKRKNAPADTPVISEPEAAAKLMDDIKDKKQEYVILLTLDGERKLINKHIVSIGTLMTALVHPREVFALAVEDRAASIILGHNHPSGTMEINECDRNVTKRIKEAGVLLGIPLDDHIVVSKRGFVSIC